MTAKYPKKKRTRQSLRGDDNDTTRVRKEEERPRLWLDIYSSGDRQLFELEEKDESAKKQPY
jgi:hypothetical protein